MITRSDAVIRVFDIDVKVTCLETVVPVITHIRSSIHVVRTHGN